MKIATQRTISVTLKSIPGGPREEDPVTTARSTGKLSKAEPLS